MKITIEPTEDMESTPFNGVEVPLRIWKGKTAGGVQIEALVLGIMPLTKAPDQKRKLEAELPAFMKPTRKLMAIGPFPKDEA